MSNSAALCFKTVLLGDSGVGKTSIVARWTTGVYHRIANPTVGASHHRKRVVVDDTEVDLFVWDTAGQEQFQSLTPLYARSACVAILTASMTDQHSLENLAQWSEVLSAAAEAPPPVILAVNKVDLRESAQTTEDAIASKYGRRFAGQFFVSALTGEGVDNLFLYAAQLGYRFALANRAPESVLSAGGAGGGVCDC
jgi:small GTP-binding protein